MNAFQNISRGGKVICLLRNNYSMNVFFWGRGFSHSLTFRKLAFDLRLGGKRGRGKKWIFPFFFPKLQENKPSHKRKQNSLERSCRRIEPNKIKSTSTRRLINFPHLLSFNFGCCLRRIPGNWKNFKEGQYKDGKGLET